MNRTYQYDAFISYRHLAPDKPIAERLQKLLETYIPPKHLKQDEKAVKLRLFRDETELPTSSDLGSDIEHALEQSRFLIVICSRNFSLSKWCMKELDYFKSLHNGNVDKILTVWVGEPDERPQFPDLLRFRENKLQNSNGTYSVEAEEIEPLAANVSAGSQKQAMKKLRTEFLRIAAPLLGCGYDDLFMREQRRRTRRKLATAFAIVGVLAVVALLSTTAFFKIVSQNRELVKTNAEILVRESKTLESTGDYYGALNAAVQALPDKEGRQPVLNSALQQAASLSGAFEPEIFTAYKSLDVSEDADEIYLLNSGKRLLAIGDHKSSLWDVETGALIRLFSNSVDGHLLVYISPKLCVNNVDSKSSFRSRISNCSRENEDALFYANDTDGLVERISIDDGSVVWSVRLEFPELYDDIDIVNHRIDSNDGLPVYDSGGFFVLDQNTGKILAQVDRESIQQITGELEFIHYVYTKGYLILYGENEERTEVFVLKKTKSTFLCISKFNFLSDDIILRDKKMAFLVRDKTLFVSYKSELSKSGICAIDLKSGSQKWGYENDDAYYTTDQQIVAIGMINHRNPKVHNDYDIVFSVVGNDLFVINAETGDLLDFNNDSESIKEFYYTEDGFLYFIKDSGSEDCALLQGFSSESIYDYGYIKFEPYDFGTKIDLVSFDSNLYAMKPKGSHRINFYRLFYNNLMKPIDIHNLGTDYFIHQLCMDSKHSLAAIQFSMDPKVSVLDLKTNEIIITLDCENDSLSMLSFIDNNHLIVEQNRKWSIFDLSTGEEVNSLSRDDYYIPYNTKNKFGPLLYLRTYSDSIDLIRSSQESEKIINVKKEPQIAAKDSKTLNDFWTSPSGNVLALQVRVDGMEKLFLYNVTTKEIIELDTSVFDGYVLFDQCIWNEESNVVYFSYEKESKLFILSYNIQTGNRVTHAPLPAGIVGMNMIEDQLCMLDYKGILYQVDTSHDVVHFGNTIELLDLDMELSSQKNNLFFEPFSKSKGFLHCDYQTWLIDTDKFEIIYEIENFCGFDADKDIVYTNDGYSINSYPIYSPQELKAYANSILE